MATKSSISTMTASSIQDQINKNNWTRDDTAKALGFSNGGALHNALQRYFPEVTFSFTKRINGNGNGNANKPIAVNPSIVSALHRSFSALDSSIPAIDDADFATWTALYPEHPFISALDAALEIDALVAFCDRTGSITPRVSAYRVELEKKTVALTAAAVRAATGGGRFVVGPLGHQTLCMDASSSITAICETAIKIANEDTDNEDTNEIVNHISRAKTNLDRLERDCLALAQSARLTLNACRVERNKARDSVLNMEASLQPIISKLANKPRYSAEQAALIQNCVNLGMSEQEAVTFLKGKGKL